MSVSRSREDSAALGGIVNGYAPLDSGLLIPQAYIPKAGTGAPGMVLLEQHAASASATLDFTSFISSTYDEYDIELLNIVAATDATTLRMRMGTGGGPTYDTGSVYYWNSYVARLGATANTGSAADSAISLMYTAVQDNTVTAWGGLTGSFRFVSPQSTSFYKRVFGHAYVYSTDDFDAQSQTWGTYMSTTAVTAVRFFYASGNITSGTIRVYGIPK